MKRLGFYSKFWIKYFTQSFDGKIPNEKFLPEYKSEIDYYCKINKAVKLQDGIELKDVKLLKNSGYTYDL